MIWQVLDVRAVWIKEMASALSRQVPTLGWLPRFSPTGIFQNQEEEFSNVDPPLRIRSFPLQRGFARFPLNAVLNEANRIAKRLLMTTASATTSPLICTTPHYAQVAAAWPGPTIYYVTDYFPAYRNEPEIIGALDRKMCGAAALVCPNSQRIADYLMREALCPAAKLLVIPNGTRDANVLSAPPVGRDELPPAIADLPRPIAGVIGNLAENTDWILLRETMARTPWLSWVFVGPTEMTIADANQREARRIIMLQGGHVRFVGSKDYRELRDYARGFDVAILPYQKREPTYSGSSTRFYEHLAATRPMLATKGFEELLHKEPLVRLVESAEQMAAALEQLRATEFHDGHEELRWRTSRRETWEQRASQMIAALAKTASRADTAVA